MTGSTRLSGARQASLIACTLALVAALAAGCAASIARDQSSPAFALFGDVPYSQAHANLLEDTIDEINRAPVAFAVHLGDITAGTGPCTDAWLQARAEQFARVAGRAGKRARQ